jgi:hypothetical protein
MAANAGPARWHASCYLLPREHLHETTMSDTISPEEVLALLFPEPASAGSPSLSVTAFVRDPQGGLMLASVVPSRTLLESARVTGRWNSGTPILDPHTREIIGYELSPLAVA